MTNASPLTDGRSLVLTQYLQVWALLVGETQLIQQNTTKMVITQVCGNDAKCTRVNRTDPTMEATTKFSNTTNTRAHLVAIPYTYANNAEQYTLMPIECCDLHSLGLYWEVIRYTE